MPIPHSAITARHQVNPPPPYCTTTTTTGATTVKRKGAKALAVARCYQLSNTFDTQP